MTRKPSRLFAIRGVLIVVLLSAVQSAVAASRPSAVAPLPVAASSKTQHLTAPIKSQTA